MYNLKVKFGLKSAKHLGKMSEKFRGGGLTHTEHRHILVGNVNFCESCITVRIVQ